MMMMMSDDDDNADVIIFSENSVQLCYKILSRLSDGVGCGSHPDNVIC